MSTPRRDDVHGHASVEQQRFMGAAKIVQPQLRETQLGGPPSEFFGRVVRVLQLGESEILPGCRRLSVVDGNVLLPNLLILRLEIDGRHQPSWRNACRN
jgi:hypothetical protein